MRQSFSILFFSFIAYFSNSQELKIAFGSCGKQDKPLEILKDIADQKPDYFIYLGDNIYGDTRDMNLMKSKYDQLAANPNFQALKASTKLLATWDDHDFGENDAGRHYPMKEASKALFLEFFEEPKNSPRYQHPGIYTSYTFKKKGKRIQLILLDTRTFRDDVLLVDRTQPKDSIYFYDMDYAPIQTPDSAFLGTEQWQWLEQELSKKADLRIIGSSTQFGISYNSYEAWANFPYEQQRMLDLIAKTKANGVVFISGDVHYAELSTINNPKAYPIYDLTASGLTQSWHFATPNSNRIAGPVMENHYGMLRINPKKRTVTMQIIDNQKQIRIEKVLDWTTLIVK